MQTPTDESFAILSTWIDTIWERRLSSLAAILNSARRS
jgi:hypothetical protein